MILAVLEMTILVTVGTVLYNPASKVSPYERKTIQKTRSEEELRVVACLHGFYNVPSMINILEASNPSQKSPISVFALQLVELIGRASAMVVVHTTRKAGSRNPTHEEAQTEQIISAFDNYELRSDGVKVQTLTARAAYNTMDEDICNVAKDNRAAFIILPFYRQQTPDGEMEDINPSIRTVNENVLAHAPCSVAVLIDRRMPDNMEFPRRVAVLFFGGPDDREALAYGWRMSEHQHISLRVVRLVPSQHLMQNDPMDFLGPVPGIVSVPIDSEKEKMLDDDYITKFRNNTADSNSVLYQELVLNDEEETIRAIKSMDTDHDLFIVGRGRGMSSPLTAGLADWCDCPELGPIGDLFATSEFSSPFSVLVMQQYVRREGSRDGSDIYTTGSVAEQEMESLEWRPSNVESNPFGSFSNREVDISQGSFRLKEMEHSQVSSSSSSSSYSRADRNLSR